MPSILGANTLSGGFDVANSLRFNSGSSDYLTRTFGTPTSSQKWTLSFWIKRCKIGSANEFIFNTDGGNEEDRLSFNGSGDTLTWYEQNSSGGTVAELTTSQSFRDPSAWYHIVLARDSTQGTSSNRIKLYVNGSQVTALGTATYPSQNDSSRWNTAVAHEIGARNAGTFVNLYMAETVFIDGQQLDATSFGEFDEDSSTIWKPIDVSDLTFGNNGFYLPFLADGTNAGFVDFSSNNYAVTRVGSTIHSFAQAKFDSSSIYFDGSGDALTLADGNQWDFGTGDYTLEFWVNKAHTGKESVFETRGGGGNGFNIEFNSSNVLEWYDGSITGTLPVDGSAVTANTWVHFALVRASNVHKMYRNGTEVGTALTSSSSQQSTGGPNIGRRLESSSANDYTGYLDEIRLSTVARYTSNFTAPSASFVSDSDTRLLIQSKASNLLGGDNSGEGNHFTTNNLTAIDQSTDTCTNNFATLNPLTKRNGGTLSEGNLKYTASTDDSSVFGTIGIPSGMKVYFEAKLVNNTAQNFIGIFDKYDAGDGAFLKGGSESGSYGYKVRGSASVVQYFNNGSGTDTAISNYANGTIIGVAIDNENGQIHLSANGTYINSSDPTDNNPNALVTGFDTTIEQYLHFSLDTTSSQPSIEYNFGSPPYSISSGNADANGYGNFEYSVPSGYYALNSKNLAEFG